MYLVFFRAVSQDWARTRLSVIGLIHMYMQVKIIEGRDGAYVDGNAHVGPILVYSRTCKRNFKCMAVLIAVLGSVTFNNYSYQVRSLLTKTR